MFNPLKSFYAERRLLLPRRVTMREDGTTVPPENLLQAIWFHQRIIQDKLFTTDKIPVRILHPGFWNHGHGPDFNGAVIQFGKDKPISGDIELDIRVRDWHAHKHDENPEFKKVILHVIWEEGASNTGKPTLHLQPVLDSLLGELDLWLGSGSPKLPDIMLGKCHGPLKDLGPEELQEILKQAALVRLEEKAFHIRARAKQTGWNQALWEGLLRGLGYKNNSWPMQRLAELTSEKWGDCRSPLQCQARFFGLSGLLPHDFPGKNLEYGRSLWDSWWREQERFSDVVLPKAVWRFAAIRPSNHPQRRIALASHWSWQGNLVKRLETWFENPGKHPAASLLTALGENEDDFWSWHYTLNSKKSPRAEPLLGPQRLTDLAINIILPWFWARATAGKSEATKQKVEHLFLDWEASEDNSVLKKLRMRLFANEQPKLPRKGAFQQGLIQISRDYCEKCNSLCDGCAFPNVVTDFKIAAKQF